MDNNIDFFQNLFIVKCEVSRIKLVITEQVKQASAIFQCVPLEQREGVLPSFPLGLVQCLAHHKGSLYYWLKVVE